jgi:hypothetical protein
MHKQKLLLLIINLIGGTAVIGSYVLGLVTHPGQTEVLWGGVPVGIRSLISFNMLLAATGYLIIFSFLLLRVQTAATIGKLPFWTFNLLYFLILVPSAAWMPLTFSVVDTYTIGRWLAVILSLGITGLASIGLLFSLLFLRPHPVSVLYRISVVGGVFLVLQTAVLDAILWSFYYLK